MPSADFNVTRASLLNEAPSVALKSHKNGEAIPLDNMNNSAACESDIPLKTLNEKKRRRKKIIAAVMTIIIIVLIGVIAIVALQFIGKDKDSKKCVNGCNSGYGSTGPSQPPVVTTGTTATTTKLKPTTTKKHKNETEICTSAECVLISQKLKQSINFSVDPCENFHEYACGLWPQYHPIPPSEPKLDTMGLLNLQKDEALKNVIEAEMKSNLQPEDNFKSKIFRFYKSCTNSERVDKLGSDPLKTFLSAFGTFSPIKSQPDTKELDLTSIILKSHGYFTPSVYDDSIRSPLFKSIVKVNDLDSSKHILEFNVPDFPIADPSVYILKDGPSKNTREKYRNIMNQYVQLLGETENANERMDKIIEFEIKVATLAMKASYIRNVMQRYNLTSIQEFREYVGPEIDWLRLIKGYFAPLGIPITNQTTMMIRSVDYFFELNKLIANTDIQIVKDYVIWVTLWKFGAYAGKEFQEAEHEYMSAVLGLKEHPARWKKCITDLEQTLEFGMAALYVNTALKDEDKYLATEILLNITEEFKRNLASVTWMDDGTKAKAYDKINSIRYNIGYPDYVKNSTHMTIMYDNVTISTDTYFENLLDMYTWKRRANIALLYTKVDRTVYDLPPTLVEAYFDPNKNKMVFLAGILQMPFYDTKGPMALNYGALGLVVGHEVTHAFDDLGRQFDKNGERKNWWSEKSSQNFKERSNCISQQYSSYKMFGMNVDGNLTLGENIADNGGIKVAYMAYKRWQETHGKEPRLPDIPLTMEQLLFVSHGQVWCGAYREAYVKRQLKIDYHSPAKYRVIGPLSNLEEFSQAFKCPLGSTMNPHKKCRVW